MNDTVEREPAETHEKFQVIFDSVSDGIFVIDAETGRFTDVNAAGCTMFGFTRDALIGATIETLSAGVPPYTQLDALHVLDETGAAGPRTFEWYCKTKDGRLFWAEISLRCVPFGDRDVGLAIVRDITERKHRVDELAAQAHVDVLTGLPNRRGFDLTLQQEVARSERYGAPLCIAMGDIDYFKLVNDSFGHQTGDAVLKRLGEFLRAHFRRTDYVARWGGEEFTILFPETPLERAKELLNRVRASIADYVIPEIGRAVTLSFAITAYRKGEKIDDLLRRCDEALYRSKEAGRDRVSRV